MKRHAWKVLKLLDSNADAELSLARLRGCLTCTRPSPGFRAFCDHASYMNPGRKRRDIRQRGEKVVGFVKEIDLPIALALGHREENTGTVTGAESDIGAEASSAAGLLDDRRWGIWISELDPGQSNTRWIACMAEALNGFKLVRLE